MPEQHRPRRTCVGCRTASDRSELVRLCRDRRGRVRIDGSGRAAGRGAYVHPREECIGRAARGGVLARALRTDVDPVEAARLMDEVRRSAGESA